MPHWLAAQVRARDAKVTCIQADVSNLSDMAGAPEHVANELGGVGCLIDNAGQMLLSPFSAQGPWEWYPRAVTNPFGASASPMPLDTLVTTTTRACTFIP